MADNAPLIVSVSGVRGIVGESLTDDTVRGFAAAFASTLPSASRVVLGRDPRPSGEGFASVAAEALRHSGCVVFDLGICSTPAAKIMVVELGAGPGLVITASHNPAPWNGMKMIRSDGVFLNDEQGQRLADRFRDGLVIERGGGHIESVDRARVIARHLSRVLGSVDVEAIGRAGLRVAVDTCNGSGGVVLPPLLTELGVEATFINAEPDGRFAHDPEPIAENLVDLGTAVRDSSCCLGFAIDPDADRVTLVGEDGEAVGEDYTLALAVRAVTARRRGPVVTTLSTSQIVTDAARQNDCPVLLTPVGEVHVVEKMLAERAVIGGEGNGGAIITDIVPGRDAAVGVALLLEALAATADRSLGTLVDELPHYSIVKRKLECDVGHVAGAAEQLLRRYAAAIAHPVEDGVKLYLSGRFECPWIHLRGSNTEPVVRTIAESESLEEAEKLCDEAEELLQS